MAALEIGQPLPPELTERQVGQLIEATCRHEQAELSRVSVSFVTAETIRGLNREHRGKDQATDVLSFPFDDRFPQGAGGEVVVAPEVARQNAAAAGRDAAAELSLLIVHGTLHLLGYRDETADQAARMDRASQAILGGVHG